MGSPQRPSRKGKPASRRGAPPSWPPRPVARILVLYLAGMNERSRTALRNVETLCREHLRGRTRLVVVDVYRQPQRASRDQIVAVPALVSHSPTGRRVLIGDLSNFPRVLLCLGIARG
jgi:circadian clock protein KaiB